MAANLVDDSNYVKDHLLNDKTYDFLKWLALIGLPALGSLYFGLAQIWGLPNAEKVVGTIVVIDTFLGVLLNVAAKSYNTSESKYDGTIDVEQVEGGPKRFTLNLNGDPETLDTQNQVVFKINQI